MPLKREYRLLIADDDAAFRETLCAIFEPFFQLVEANSGAEALEAAQRQTVHVALFDLNMPVLTGLEVACQVRQLLVPLPCILVTADYTEELRQTACELACFSVLPKPVTRKQVVGTVAAAVDAIWHDFSFCQKLISPLQAG